MTRSFLALAFLTLVGVALLLYWRIAIRAHQRRLRQLDVRVHVNGIRGKSTVTRLVAGVLREGGYVTVAKTTGSAARVIGPSGEETPIFRRGAANINEQIDVVAEHVREDVEALVIECMAVRPLYQQYSQEYMVRSDITVITNVREDHQEEMGETLEEIADSMSVTIPRGGIVVTAEDREHLRERLAQRTRLGAGLRRSRGGVRRGHARIRLPPVQVERRDRARDRTTHRRRQADSPRGHVEVGARRRRRPVALLRHSRQAGAVGSDVRGQRPRERRPDLRDVEGPVPVRRNGDRHPEQPARSRPASRVVRAHGSRRSVGSPRPRRHVRCVRGHRDQNDGLARLRTRTDPSHGRDGATRPRPDPGHGCGSRLRSHGRARRDDQHPHRPGGTAHRALRAAAWRRPSRRTRPLPRSATGTRRCGPAAARRRTPPLRRARVAGPRDGDGRARCSSMTSRRRSSESRW
ncbi:hypothetical protein DW322_18490 [Rhodococcus rhodnii]|uniref:Mur ligase central domain-containing protein n=1 Tax=Rhodococcus rhodnii TaxID=38312 RepID=A0A6P2CKH8_9NOCA|nr:hypothetical protein DW322_18490 [Rhodococcus rhodnii]